MNAMEAADEHAAMASVLSRQAGQYVGLKGESAHLGTDTLLPKKFYRWPK